MNPGGAVGAQRLLLGEHLGATAAAAAAWPGRIKNEIVGVHAEMLRATADGWQARGPAQ